MGYRLKYDPDADVLLVLLKGEGRLSHAEEVGDVVLHLDKRGKPLFLEVLRASRIVPMMVRAMAKQEVVA